jgi:hypothetical protein
MNNPKIRIMCVSNVYSRMMVFEKAGDVELGHQHTFDHGTLLSAGQLKIEILNDDGAVVKEKIFTAPQFIYISKDEVHRLTALEDNTIAVCIHAMRDAEENILPSDSLVECVRGDALQDMLETTPFSYQYPAIIK